MKAAVVLVLILGVVHELSGLKCRGEEDGSDDAEFRDAVRTCATGDFRWNPESDGEDADFKYSPYGRRSHRPGQSTSDSRHRNVRSGNSRGRPDSGGMERDYRTYGNPDQTRTDAETEEQPLHQMEPCAVHCIFRQLGMLNNDDMPDKGTMTYVMTRNVREQRVKWFIEDSVDECFELFQPEDRSGKCDFAKNLGLCFQEKGRRTCEDWDGAVSDQENNNKNNNQNNHNNQNNNNNHNHNHNQNNNNHYKLH